MIEAKANAAGPRGQGWGLWSKSVSSLNSSQHISSVILFFVTFSPCVVLVVAFCYLGHPKNLLIDWLIVQRLLTVWRRQLLPQMAVTFQNFNLAKEFFPSLARLGHFVKPLWLKMRSIGADMPERLKLKENFFQQWLQYLDLLWCPHP